MPAPTWPPATPPAPPTASAPPPTGRTRRGIAIVVALALLLGGGFVVGRWVIGDSSTSSSATTPTTAAPTTLTDPGAVALTRLIVQQGDVASAFNVQLLPGGDQVRGQTTLDLCNGRFATEADRAARLQDVVDDAQGNSIVSTEAVLYRSVADSVRAFDELRKVAASCPHSPVTSPVGEPTVATRFNARPDATWPQTPGVDRLAYSFDTTDQLGQNLPSVAVYLRRGRALMGVYFQHPEASQPAVGGQTSLSGIVGVFAGRLARLPSSVVDGP